MNHIYILSTISAMILSAIGYKLYETQRELYSAQSRLEASQANLIDCKEGASHLLASIQVQNKEIELMHDKYIAALDVKPLTIVETKEKLKIVYRDREIPQEECKRVSSTIDAIRNAGI